MLSWKILQILVKLYSFPLLAQLCGEDSSRTKRNLQTHIFLKNNKGSYTRWLLAKLRCVRECRCKLKGLIIITSNVSPWDIGAGDKQKQCLTGGYTSLKKVAQFIWIPRGWGESVFLKKGQKEYISTKLMVITSWILQTHKSKDTWKVQIVNTTDVEKKNTSVLH